MNNEFEQARARLATHVSRWTGDAEECRTAIPALTLHRHTRAGEPISCLLEPAIALPVQGAKCSRLGSDDYVYDQSRFLITSLDLPVAMQVAKASPARPYLSAVLRLDARVIGDLVAEIGEQPTARGSGQSSGMVLGRTDLGLLRAFERLVELLDEPALIPMLAPMAQREIFYRVLLGDAGGALWQMAAAEDQNQKVGRAIDWLKHHFRQRLSIGELAAQVGMSPSRFHHHFRRLTSMSPLQFQKWLRLTEARRLMLLEGADASTAAFEVGYESPSQFSREYGRQFGAPPRRDVASLLQQPG